MKFIEPLFYYTWLPFYFPVVCIVRNIVLRTHRCELPENGMAPSLRIVLH
jgi:hypothetical protein